VFDPAVKPRVKIKAEAVILTLVGVSPKSLNTLSRPIGALPHARRSFARILGSGYFRLVDGPRATVQTAADAIDV
jgi:hypothetical protein